jgi:D-alanyl-D-alanine carboxypeptidase (penicillin-binding protein 5/6)
MDVRLPQSVTAPVKQGDLIGEVHLILGEEELGVVAIVAAEDAERSRLLMTLDRMQAVTRTFLFKFAVVFVVLAIVLYAFLIVEKQRSRYRYQGAKRR